MKTLKRILKIIGVLVATAVLIIIGLYIATDSDNTVPDTVTTDTTIPYVEIDGVVFHAETFGNPQNPVVVVVHGGPGGDYGYLLNLHQLEDDYFVVFYDQRGAGLSPRVAASELTLQSSIDDLHRIVTHYGNGEAVSLVGHSWGGMLAAGYLGQYPEFVDKAVLAEPGALDNAGLARFNERQTATTQGVAYYRTLVPTIFETMHMELPDEQAQNDYIFGQMSAAFVGSAASTYNCEEQPANAQLPQVPVPPSRFGSVAFSTIFGPDADLSAIADNAANYTDELLFVASECNDFIGATFQQQQMMMFPQPKLTIIPNAGHNMFSDNPAESIAAVRTFLAEETVALKSNP